jgi:hypothetical protein
MNIFDRVPQVPNDWSNHFIYGGALGIFSSTLVYAAIGLKEALIFGTIVPLLTCLLKKLYQIYTKEESSISIALSKTIVTGLFSAILLGVTYLK